MKKVAVIGCIIENPAENHILFNNIVADYKGVVRGRMGIPFDENNLSVITLTVVAPLDEVNSLTGKLGKIPGISVKTAISNREI